MSVGTAIYSHLSGESAITALVGDRIFLEAAPGSVDPATEDYIVFTQASNDHTRHFGGSSGLASPRFIFEIFARTFILAESIADALRVAWDGLRDSTMGSGNLDVRNIRLETDASSFIPPTSGSDRGTYVRRLDFIITHAESVPTL